MIDNKLRNLSRNRLYNLHTHTPFCDGMDKMEAFCAAALQAGFVALGFSPHAPFGIPSPCNMSYDHVTRYLDEVKRLKELYAGSMEVLASMEVDFLQGHSGPSSSYYQDLNLDYIIGSVHFIKDFKGEFVDVDGRPEQFSAKLRDHFRNDLRYVVSKYFESMGEMIIAGGYDIIGHIDKIAFNASAMQAGVEDEGWYAGMAHEVLDLALKSGKIIEINTKAYERNGRFFPDTRYWRGLIEGGADFTVNSDAHYADRLHSGRDRAFSLLEEMGYLTGEGMIERHPWEPFIPANAKALVMGTFPPGDHRWSMDFYYPNKTNDFWKMMGLIFNNDPARYYDSSQRSYDLAGIKRLVTERGIAMSDTVRTARRLKNNASDKFLDVIEANDVCGLLRRMPGCVAVGCTGEKAAEIAAAQLGVAPPATGMSVPVSFEGRRLTLWRLPSTSRAYPLALEKKAEPYKKFFIAAGCLAV